MHSRPGTSASIGTLQQEVSGICSRRSPHTITAVADFRLIQICPGSTLSGEPSYAQQFRSDAAPSCADMSLLTPNHLEAQHPARSSHFSCWPSFMKDQLISPSKLQEAYTFETHQISAVLIRANPVSFTVEALPLVVPDM